MWLTIGQQSAHLKAMGYTDRFLSAVVMQEAAVMLSVLGFIPGLLVSLLLYRLGADITGLMFNLTLERTVSLYVLTFMMCLVAGSLAVRKVQRTDPAEVFGL
jgi:putative ABC transport system permease protein